MVCRCCNKDGPCFDSDDCAPGYKCCVDSEGNGLCTIEPSDWSVTLPFTVVEGNSYNGSVTHSGGCDGEEYYVLYFPATSSPAQGQDLQASNGPFYTTIVQSGPGGTESEGQFPFTVVGDNLVEPDEYFLVKIYRENSIFSELLATSNACRILGITWEVEPLGGNSVSEGASKSFKVTATGAPAGTEYGWRVDHISTSNSDYTGDNGLPAINNPTGVGTVDGNGFSSFTIPIFPDAFTEGEEKFRVQITYGGTFVATSVDVTVTDTSQTPSGVINCGTAAASGGIQFTTQYYSVTNGSGTVRVHYNVGNLADRFIFYPGGGTVALHDTGFITGQGVFSFTKPSGVRTIRVTSQGQDSNTRWCYTLMCPNDTSTPPECNPFA